MDRVNVNEVRRGLHLFKAEGIKGMAFEGKKPKAFWVALSLTVGLFAAGVAFLFIAEQIFFGKVIPIFMILLAIGMMIVASISVLLKNTKWVQKIFEPTNGPRRWFSIIFWWEIRRIPFNLILGFIGFLSLLTLLLIG